MLMSGLNQSEIIEMANQAGIVHPQMVINTLETFAKLVAQHEREACARVCEEQYEYYGHDHVFADAIRARNET
jgi:hypothetical protein